MWQKKDDNGEGVFDGCALKGIKYENASSLEIGWVIIGIISGRAFWVTGENFYSAPTFYADGSRIEIHDSPITERIELAERKAVLKAIDEWNTSSKAA
jgi:hypothetical protein